jgi:nitronate monooxygenase
MPIHTTLTRRLGITHPIIQAPMGGGATTTDLVVAVCEAGALGSVAAAYLTPEQIVEAAQAVRARTSKPFAINLFAPVPAPAAPSDSGPALRRLAPFHAELGLPAPAVPVLASDAFGEQVRASLESGAAVFSFTFGLLPPGAMQAAKARGMLLFGTATTIDEAVALEAAGVDAVVAQGSEAGAHRGSFAVDFDAAMVGTVALVPQAVDAVSVPIIASGGIMDGRGVAAALALGASAVQLGTAFLTCDEAGIPESYKQAILISPEHRTRITRAFSGRPARGIVNRFMTEVDRADEPEAILPFPLQNALTRSLRGAAAKQNRAEFLSLWAGQGIRLARRGSAAGLVARLAMEAETVIGKLAAAR